MADEGLMSRSSTDQQTTPEGEHLTDRVNARTFEIDIKLPFLVAIVILVLVCSMAMGQLIPEMRWTPAIIVPPIVLFLPGFLTLRAFGIKLKSFAESTLMAIGLSIALIMLVGLSANFLLPPVGISDPLSMVPLTILLSVLLVGLATFAVWRGEDTVRCHPTLTPKIRPYHLFLALTLIVTLLGTEIQNSYSSNVGLVISLSMICLTVVLASFRKIPRKAYAVTIFVMSFSLLLHTSLISDFVWGWDIQKEYYSASTVIHASVWNPVRYSNVDAMLSIVILGPFISLLSGIDIEVVLRTIYPFIFSFVPVGMYVLFKKQTSEEIAFLSSFFVISFFTFFSELPQLARQEIAELFAILLLLLIADIEITKEKKTVLFAIFAFSLVVSHYGTYYFFIAILLIGYVIGMVLKKWKQAKDDVAIRSSKSKETAANKDFNLSLELLLLIVFFSLAWYTFSSNSAPLLTILDIIERMINSVLKGLFDWSLLNGVGSTLQGTDTPLEAIWNIVQLAFAVAIVIGLFAILKNIKNKYNGTLTSINIATFGVLAGCMVLPYLSSSLNPSRVYHLGLLILAPTVIIGVTELIKKLTQLSRHTKPLGQHALKIMAVIVAVSLAFNAGLVYEAIGDGTASFALDKNYDFPRFAGGEVTGVKWTVEMVPSTILADDYRTQLFFSFTATAPIIISPSLSNIPPNSIIYLGKYNIDNHELDFGSKHVSWADDGMLQILRGSSKVYASDFSEAWYYAHS